MFEMLRGSPPFYSKDRPRMFEMIKNQTEINFGTLDSDSKDLLSRLLDKDPETRLGSSLSGTQDIMDHPWFKDINFE